MGQGLIITDKCCGLFVYELGQKRFLVFYYSLKD